MSESLPSVRRRAVIVSRYETITHTIVAISVLKYLVSVGRAIFTILPSSVAMNTPTDTTNMVRHLYPGSICSGVSCIGMLGWEDYGL
jgi:hypothetical protein